MENREDLPHQLYIELIIIQRNPTQMPVWFRTYSSQYVKLASFTHNRQSPEKVDIVMQGSGSSEIFSIAKPLLLYKNPKLDRQGF